MQYHCCQFTINKHNVPFLETYGLLCMFISDVGDTWHLDSLNIANLSLLPYFDVLSGFIVFVSQRTCGEA